MNHATTGHRGLPSSITRASLNTGSAVAAVLALSLPGVALAQAAPAPEACGPLVNGAVVCPVDPALYPDGVAYVIGAPAGDIEIGLAPGAEIAAWGPALTVINPFGDLTITADQAHVVSTDDESTAILALAGTGSVSINVAGAATFGMASNGIVGFADAGDVTIVAGETFTFGDASTGIKGVSNAGDIRIEVGSLSTAGQEATGIHAIAYDGDIHVSAGVLSTADHGSRGVKVINITETGQSTVDVGQLYTRGDGSTGVFADVVNTVAVNGGVIMTEGAGAHAVSTWTQNGLNAVTAQEIGTFGDGSVGVLAESDAGDVSVAIDALRTTGSQSYGVFADSVNGNVKVAVSAARTEGAGSDAIIAYSEFGTTEVGVGSVETMRDLSVGVFAGGGAGVDVNVGKVVTSGYGSLGVQMVAGALTEDYTTFGDAHLTVGSVETRGFQAAGVSVVSVGSSNVVVGSARTYGEDSDGVGVAANFGDATIDVGQVHTSGFRATGVYAGANEGDLHLRLGQGLTEGDLSSVIRVQVRRGDTDILVTGDLTTAGEASRGVIASASYGDMKVVSQGVVRTGGDFSQGLYTAVIGRTSIAATDVRTLGDYSTGIEAWSAADAGGTGAPHSIDIVAGSVTTAGAQAHGIKATNAEVGVVAGLDAAPDAGVALRPTPDANPTPARSDDGVEKDIHIQAATVAVTGLGAKGVLADGARDVTLELTHVSSRQDDALSITARADATITAKGLISGGDAGADVSAENITFEVAKSGRVLGVTDALVLSAVGPYVPPEDGGGGIGPFQAASPGLVTVDNAGLVQGGSGAAILVKAGTATINNAGRIEGALRLADGDDRVVNAGAMLVSTDSDFGAGDDLFTNTGVVQFAKAPAPLSLSFLGLERFTNEGGLIDLRNERAGDVLTLAGAYSGTGKARLGLDVGPTAVDHLVVTGAATGKTSILLQGLEGQAATLMAKPVSLISVGAGSAADAFEIGDADHGLVRYGLAYNAATLSYELDATAGLAVHQSLRAGEGLRTASRASIDAFNVEQAQSRSSGAEGRRVWVQAFGETVDRDGDDDAQGLAYDQDLVGGQMGLVLATTAFAGGQADLGVTAGYVDSTLTFMDGGQDVDLRTLNAGAYAAWRQGRLFATGLVKIDHHRLSIDDDAAGFETDLDGLTWGAQLEAGYRFQVGALTLESLAGLDVADTSLDDLEVFGQSVAFDDENVVSVRLGGRASARHALANGGALTFTGGLEAVQALDTDQNATLVSGGQSETVTLESPETFGKASASIEFETAGGLQTYVQAEGRFGDGQGGGGLRIGARYRF